MTNLDGQEETVAEVIRCFVMLMVEGAVEVPPSSAYLEID